MKVYHGGKKRDAVDQAGGAKPRLGGENSVEVGKSYRPLKE